MIAQVSSLTVGNSFSAKASYVGSNGKGSIGLQFRVTCAENYYGSNCTTKCIPTNSSKGHYTCNDDGTITCLTGWSGANTNCLTREFVILT